MSISATAVSQLTVVETLTDDVPFAPGASITHNGLNATAKLSATTTPAGSAVAAIAVPLVGRRGHHRPHRHGRHQRPGRQRHGSSNPGREDPESRGQ